MLVCNKKPCVLTQTLRFLSTCELLLLSITNLILYNIQQNVHECKQVKRWNSEFIQYLKILSKNILTFFCLVSIKNHRFFVIIYLRVETFLCFDKTSSANMFLGNGYRFITASKIKTTLIQLKYVFSKTSKK